METAFDFWILESARNLPSFVSRPSVIRRLRVHDWIATCAHVRQNWISPIQSADYIRQARRALAMRLYGVMLRESNFCISVQITYNVRIVIRGILENQIFVYKPFDW